MHNLGSKRTVRLMVALLLVCPLVSLVWSLVMKGFVCVGRKEEGKDQEDQSAERPFELLR